MPSNPGDVDPKNQRGATVNMDHLNNVFEQLWNMLHPDFKWGTFYPKQLPYTDPNVPFGESGQRPVPAPSEPEDWARRKQDMMDQLGAGRTAGGDRAGSGGGAAQPQPKAAPKSQAPTPSPGPPPPTGVPGWNNQQQQGTTQLGGWQGLTDDQARALHILWLIQGHDGSTVGTGKVTQVNQSHPGLRAE